MKPRLLDLFCGAGGAAMGYARAGFEVVGVDILPQPHYPFEFHQMDAMRALEIGKVGFPFELIDSFDAIHASPPCQDHSSLSVLQDDSHGTGWMLARTLEHLCEYGVPWIVENVGGARGEMGNRWVQLCGSSFGLGVRRHRLFAASFMPIVPQCVHHLQPFPIDVTGTGGPGGRHRKPRSLAEARDAMGIDWMDRRELSQAIPPAYTSFLGVQLLAAVGMSTETKP